MSGYEPRSLRLPSSPWPLVFPPVMLSSVTSWGGWLEENVLIKFGNFKPHVWCFRLTLLVGAVNNGKGNDAFLNAVSNAHQPVILTQTLPELYLTHPQMTSKEKKMISIICNFVTLERWTHIIFKRAWFSFLPKWAGLSELQLSLGNLATTNKSHQRNYVITASLQSKSFLHQHHDSISCGGPNVTFF